MKEAQEQIKKLKLHEIRMEQCINVERERENANKRELVKLWWNWVSDDSKYFGIIPRVCTNLKNSKWLEMREKFNGIVIKVCVNVKMV